MIKYTILLMALFFCSCGTDSDLRLVDGNLRPIDDSGSNVPENVLIDTECKEIISLLAPQPYSDDNDNHMNEPDQLCGTVRTFIVCSVNVIIQMNDCYVDGRDMTPEANRMFCDPSSERWQP